MADHYNMPVNCKHVLACKNFYTASRYAAEQGWALREWFWVAGTTVYVVRYDKVEH